MTTESGVKIDEAKIFDREREIIRIFAACGTVQEDFLCLLELRFLAS
jgi:hypothetical protein